MGTKQGFSCLSSSFLFFSHDKSGLVVRALELRWFHWFYYQRGRVYCDCHYALRCQIRVCTRDSKKRKARKGTEPGRLWKRHAHGDPMGMTFVDVLAAGSFGHVLAAGMILGL